MVLAPVQSDKTVGVRAGGGRRAERASSGTAAVIAAEELETAVNPEPHADAARARGRRTAAVLGVDRARWSSSAWPEDHFDTLAQTVSAGMSRRAAQCGRAAASFSRVGVIWVVVGDKASIEEGLRGLQLGPVYEIDPDGNIIGRLVS